MDKLVYGQMRVTEMMKELGIMFCEKRLKKLSMFSLENRWLRGDMIICKYLRNFHVEDGAHTDL